MQEPNIVILYVANPVASATFYADLLGRPPVESSPTFAMFALENGMMLGLWSRATVEPAADAAAGCGELVFPVADDAELDKQHRDWTAKGIAIAQAPRRMHFGYNFVGLDPDGHRLRVLVPGMGD